ncbi:MAG: ATP-binding protein [Burkholderiaceae bacterium]
MQTSQPLRQPGRVIALLGAESTGKTTLAHALRDALEREGRSVAVVTEFLREFCERHGRTPRREEQVEIAAEQTLRIARAAAQYDYVVSDTTALTIAVYSEFVFGDRDLYACALRDHARYALTLLTALDIAWQGDGHQRDGVQAREPVDGLLRSALIRSATPFSVVYGGGPTRLANALAAVRGAFALGQGEPSPAPAPRWQCLCERCGEPDFERQLLRSR